MSLHWKFIKYKRKPHGFPLLHEAGYYGYIFRDGYIRVRESSVQIKLKFIHCWQLKKVILTKMSQICQINDNDFRDWASDRKCHKFVKLMTVCLSKVSYHNFSSMQIFISTVFIETHYLIVWVAPCPVWSCSGLYRLALLFFLVSLCHNSSINTNNSHNVKLYSIASNIA